MKDRKYYEELTKKVNEKIKYISSLDKEERDKYVGEVIRWVDSMYENISKAMSDKGIKGMTKAMKVANKYKEELEDLDRKATVIACILYTIKPEWQGIMGKIIIGAMGLI